MPVITIGRQFGAGGRTVGEMLARELKCDLLESQIIDKVAYRLQLPKEEVEAEDEQPGSLLARLLVALGSASTEPALIPADSAAWSPPNADPAFDTRKAVLQITQHVLEEAAHEGNVVIVGRGGAYLLHDFPGALHVFLGAARAVRVKAVMARYNIASEEEAMRRLTRADENWTAYIKQVYGHDRNHPGHYDLVIDTGRLGYEASVDVIVAAPKRRKPLT